MKSLDRLYQKIDSSVYRILYTVSALAFLFCCDVPSWFFVRDNLHFHTKLKIIPTWQRNIRL